jgi:UDP-N-acetylglucosamine--N-acetylmuramyl-(pentapeptide) pyrophosphoryl-undecaprenol N-acetylglucosamine transferase
MSKRIIISGGGTGGHIFPALAIAQALQKIDATIEILFVGAMGRMEMEKIPAAGYKIIGLDIAGIQRTAFWKNITLPFKLLKSVWQARNIIKTFKPDAAVGVGGYASGPLLLAARAMGVPYLIQEQNSYAGLTNIWLGKQAQKICVAFDGMEAYFPAEKIQVTGNPVRKESVVTEGKKAEAAKFFGLDSTKKTILLTGGSLGARTLNQAFLASIDALVAADVQVIWQTGKVYFGTITTSLGTTCPPQIKVLEFLNRMDLAYAIADVIVSRAGAGTIAELCLVKKPVILVPSPNVAEDHQTKNAQALVKHHAALMLSDAQATLDLIPMVLSLLSNANECTTLSENIGRLGKSNADEVIAKEVLVLATHRKEAHGAQ